ncbi:hypothetical protein SAMN00120144_2582 [Hymenobacter roseosalivarius DSM 11622]|uniref:DUF7674 domain-containing protein n=1 Tax=Hymenobacter roseosalivarius DSM 11622 TaxID=645990 RepID=A0A1W1VT25_9BACT|nr:hypothetical protein [Hymenobacter roseosalivarius]SMB96535.1 hypothetical protein SAMN00120144_2582 [Hymenobacter roseosalivarius DSM 11622]
MNFIIVKRELPQQEFLQHLVKQFPAIDSEVMDEDYNGLIHLQVGCLARYANNCLSTVRLDELRRVFDFFHKTLKKVDSNTENALYVSFLERVEMEGDSINAKQARMLLQSEYLRLWYELRS